MFVIQLHEFRWPSSSGSLVISYKLISKYILRFCMAAILFLLKKIYTYIVMKVKYI
jgi:hypothetical protein